MAKRVSVVLSEDVLSLGKNGDLVDVAPGYARNFLLPQGKAVPVTPAVLRQVEHRRGHRQRFALGKQVVAGIAGGYFHQIAVLAQAEDVLAEDHGNTLSHGIRVERTTSGRWITLRHRLLLVLAAAGVGAPGWPVRASAAGGCAAR